MSALINKFARVGPLIRRTPTLTTAATTTSICPALKTTGLPTCVSYASLRTRSESRHPKTEQEFKFRDPIQEMVPDTKTRDAEFTKETIEKVNEQIASESHGRLFAVISIRGHQFKVTTGDLIMIQNDLEVPMGTRINLDKVLLAGSNDFTLLGRPILPRDLVRVEAMVVERDLSHTKIRFHFIQRCNVARTRFTRKFHTTLRITDIYFLNKIGETKDLAGFLGNNLEDDTSQ